jgi:hypothetical protein
MRPIIVCNTIVNRISVAMVLVALYVVGCAKPTPPAAALSTPTPIPTPTENPAATATTTTSPALPYQVERFNLPGPMAGVFAKVDLSNARIATKIVLTDDRDPDGDGPCVGQLDMTSAAARKNDFVITMNASFFEAPTVRDIMDKKVRYYIGNCTWPVGWHVSSGKVVSKPKGSKMRAALLVANDGTVSIRDNVAEIPPATRYAVSGNALVLKSGRPTSTDENGTRHPRSVVGLSEDGKSMLLVAVDGRQEGYSRGASMKELGELMLKLGAYHAVNLDGGGSTALVIKDLRTGTFGVANQPSETSTEGFPVRMERPVADVVGITLAPLDRK